MSSRLVFAHSDGTLGRMHYAERKEAVQAAIASRAASHAFCSDMAVVSLLGPMAERAPSPEADVETSARDDLAYADAMCLLAADDDRDLAAQYCEEFISRARHLLARPNYFPPVRAVADALERKSTLVGAEVERIVAGMAVAA